MAHVFASYFSGETASAIFTYHPNRMEGEPLYYSDFKDVGHLKLNLEWEEWGFSIKKFEISLLQCRNT